MSKPRNYNKNRNRKKGGLGLATGLTVIFFLLLIIPSVVLTRDNTVSYVKDAAVIKVNVVQSQVDGDTYRLRLSPTTDQVTDKLEGFAASSGKLWGEVPFEIWAEYSPSPNTTAPVRGALISQVDTYKKISLFSSKREFVSTAWEVTDLYGSFEEAVSKNPESLYESEGTITKTHVTKKGDYFFVIEQGDRTFTAQVTKEQFEKGKVGDKIKCSFRSIGQMVRLERVVL